MRVLAGALAAMGVVALASAGEVLVIDGSTIVLDGEPIRLSGITAPAADQVCLRDGAEWPCGRLAREALLRLIGGAEVHCDGLETGRVGEVVVATCRAGSRDLGGEMTRAGWALVDQRYSTRYIREEAEAQQAGRGLWASRFRPHWVKPDAGAGRGG